MEVRTFDIKWSTLFKILCVLFLGWALYTARDVIFAFVIAFILSLIFDPIVDFLEEKKVPRVLGTLAIFLATLTVLSFVLYTVVPIAIAELRQLIVSFSSDQLPFLNFIRETYYFQEEVLTNLNEFFSDFLRRGVIVGFAGNVLSIFALTVLTIALAFYLTAARDAVKKFALFISPPQYENRIISLYSRIKRKVMLWSIGQLITSLSVGILVILGLWALGIKYYFLLGVLSAVFELIPFVGPVFVGALAIVLALNESWSTALVVLVFFIIVQQISNNVTHPLVDRLTTGLNPAVLLFAIVFAIKLFGIVGILIAVPAAILIRELLEDMYSSRRSYEQR